MIGRSRSSAKTRQCDGLSSFQESLCWRELSPFSARFHAPVQEQTFRATQNLGPEIEERHIRGLRPRARYKCLARICICIVTRTDLETDSVLFVSLILSLLTYSHA